MKIYDCVVQTRELENISLEKYKGKVLLIVNTATGCGFTPQYEALESLYKKYNEQGLEILDFPCNQFGHQAPGTDDEIREFCQMKYNTSFDQFKKIDVNGESEDRLFTFLKSQIKEDEITTLKNKISMKAIEKISKTYKKSGDIKWNFTKFLVDKEGNVIMRLSPIESPYLMEEKIKLLLQKDEK